MKQGFPLLCDQQSKGRRVVRLACISSSVSPFLLLLSLASCSRLRSGVGIYSVFGLSRVLWCIVGIVEVSRLVCRSQGRCSVVGSSFCDLNDEPDELAELEERFRVRW